MKKSNLKKLSGLSDGSLYYYEKLGLLHPQRMKNNYRVYSKSDVGKVICVQKYNRLGGIGSAIGAYIRRTGH